MIVRIVAILAGLTVAYLAGYGFATLVLDLRVRRETRELARLFR